MGAWNYGFRMLIVEVMFTNINGLHGNRDELAIVATKFDIVACVETKVRRHVSEMLCLDSKLQLCCWEVLAQMLGMA